MPDVIAYADAYGVAGYPYLVEASAAPVGTAELVWPAGLWMLESGPNIVFGVGDHAQMLDGSRQRTGGTGMHATVSGSMRWSGAAATTMRAWLPLAAGMPWVVADGVLLSYSGPLHGRFTAPVQVITALGEISADIQAVLWWP